MIKTQIQLEDWQYAALKRVGSERSRSLSDLVREGVILLLEREGAPGAIRLEDVAGKYRAVGVNDLKAHDRDWAEAIRG